MPKLFPIYIEVEELAVGKVMRLLNKTPGVAKFNLDFDRETTKLNGHRAPRGPYKKFVKTGDQLIEEAMFAQPDRKAMTTQQLRDLFVTDGRSPKSINSQLHGMKRDGDIKNTDEGWMLTKKARDRLRSRKAYKKAK